MTNSPLVMEVSARRIVELHDTWPEGPGPNANSTMIRAMRAEVARCEPPSHLRSAPPVTLSRCWQDPAIPARWELVHSSTKDFVELAQVKRQQIEDTLRQLQNLRTRAEFSQTTIRRFDFSAGEYFSDQAERIVADADRALAELESIQQRFQHLEKTLCAVMTATVTPNVL